jgi:hypothetical protein
MRSACTAGSIAGTGSRDGSAFVVDVVEFVVQPVKEITKTHSHNFLGIPPPSFKKSIK